MKWQSWRRGGGAGRHDRVVLESYKTANVSITAREESQVRREVDWEFHMHDI
jgi:hypothetical protein